MRILILTLILAIGFSGYSAAAHAFAMESCGSAAAQQSAPDCADHHGDQTPDQEADQHSSGKGICLDCHHCCAFPAAGLSDHSVNHPPQARLHHPLRADGYSDYFAVSLLRPPKNLV